MKKTNVEPDEYPVDLLIVTSIYGCIIDDKLTFREHVDQQIKKANKQMYFIRTLNTLKVDANIMTMFYNSAISTILNYCNVAFFHHLNSQTKNVLNRPRKKSCKLIKEDNKNNIIEH